MNKALITICSIGILTACSSAPIKDTSLIEQTAQNIVETGQQSSADILENARTLQIQAQQADLYLYSPKHMAQAEEAMVKAEQANKLQKPDQEIITHSLTAKTLFERGLKIKPQVEQTLSPSFEAISMLKEINSHQLLKSDFDDLEDEVKDLVMLIEDGKNNEASQDQVGLLKDVTQLEIATLKKAYLEPAQKALEKAEDADAEDYASKTFEKAEKSIEKFELTIESQYKNRELIKNTSIQNVHSSQHAENIAKAAKPLLKLNNETAEQHILFIESLLDRIKTAIEHDDITHLPLNNQSIALAQSVETLNKQAITNQSNPKWDAEKLQLEEKIASLNEQLKVALNNQKQIVAQPDSMEKPVPPQDELKDDVTSKPVTLEETKTSDTAEVAPLPLAQQTEPIATDEPAPVEEVAELNPEPVTKEVSVEATPQDTESSEQVGTTPSQPELPNP